MVKNGRKIFTVIMNYQYALLQSSSTLLLRNWQEVVMIFLDCIQRSPSSPFGSVLSVFTRCEYQKDVGNLSHIHLILEVDYTNLNSKQKDFVEDLIHATIPEIVRSEDAQKSFAKYRFISYYVKRCHKVSYSYLQ